MTHSSCPNGDHIFEAEKYHGKDSISLNQQYSQGRSNFDFQSWEYKIPYHDHFVAK